MAGSSKYDLIQTLLGDDADLAQLLRRWRAARLSAPAIARLLTLETRVPVSGQAVRMWLRALDAKSDAAA
jgi:hypothetical protein